MGYPIYHSQYTAAQIEASIGKTPRIKSSTRTWEIWDIATSAYVDTGVSIDTELFVDSTLTEAGYAADAKVTGDKIGELKSALTYEENKRLLIGKETFPVEKHLTYAQIPFEHGVVYANSGELVYTNNATGIRTTEIYDLEIGDIISVRDFTKVYISYLGVYSNNTWTALTTNITTPYTVIYPGRYYVTLKKVGDSTITDVDEVASYLEITKEKTTLEKTNYNLQLLSNALAEMKDNSLLQPLMYPILPFELGAINITGSGWSYVDNNKRIRTPQGEEFWINKGDVISLTDYTNARFYTGIREPDGTYRQVGWRQESLTAEYEGWYVLLVAKVTNETQLADISMLANLVRITRKVDLQTQVNDTINTLGYIQYPYDVYPIHGINHRGMQYEAPENTIPAFRLSVDAGYHFVETDIQFTSNDVPVLLHDTSLNRTARNPGGTELASTVYIKDITLAQALEYDFPVVNGVYDSDFDGNKIVTFEDFIIFCKRTNLFPYLELKSEATYTQAQVNKLVDILTKYNFLRSVSWISWDNDYLRMIINADKGARIGKIRNTVLTGGAVTTMDTLKTGYNRVFWSFEAYNGETLVLNEDSITRAMNADQGMSVGVISTEATMRNLLGALSNSGYISGNLSNGRTDFSKVARDVAMGV